MKKSIKSLWALLLTCTMILSANFVLPVQAESTLDSLKNNMVFELDYSGFDITDKDNAYGLTTTTYVSGERSIDAALQGTPEISVETVSGVKAFKLGTKGGVMLTDKYDNMFNSANITLETWVYKNDFSTVAPTGWSSFFGLADKTKMEFGFKFNKKLSTDAKAMLIYPAADDEQSGPSYFLEDQWQHVVFTRRNNDDATGTIANLYINGALKATYEGNTAATDTDNLWLGDYTTGDTNAAFATFKVYNKELTQNEAKAIFDSEYEAYGITPDNTGEPEDPEVPDEPEETKDPNLVFELDYSAFNATADDFGLTTTTYEKGVREMSVWKSGTPEVSVNTVDGVQALKLGTLGGFRISDNKGGMFDSASITLETWVYKDDFSTVAPTGWSKFFGLCDQQNMELGFVFNKKVSTDAQALNIYPATGHEIKGPSYFLEDEWQHVVLTRRNNDAGTGTVVNLYINGALKATYEGNTAATDTDHLWIGDCLTGETNAAFATFKVYNKEMTEADVKANFDNECEDYGITPDNTEDPEDPEVPDEPEETKDPNLVFELDYSAFDATADDFGLTTTTYEKDVREMSVWKSGTPEVSVDTVDGVQALKLGTLGGFRISDNKGGMFDSASITLETWVYKNDFSTVAPTGWSKFFGLCDQQNMELGFVFNKKVSTDAQALNIYPATGHEIKGPSYFLEDEWQHVVLTRRNNDAGTGTVVNLYINGELKATHEGNTAATDTDHLWIGDCLTGETNAAFATFKVYNKEMSATDVKAIYDKEYLDYGDYNTIKYIANGEEIEGLSGTETAVKVQVSVENEELTPMIAFIALYEGDKLIKCVPQTNSEQTKALWEFEIPLNDITVTENTVIKTFVWTQNGLVPVIVDDAQTLQCL